MARSLLCAIVVAVCPAFFALAGCSYGPTRASEETPAMPVLQYLSTWGVKGSDPGQLDQPTGIATDVQGNVYIADWGSQFVDKFNGNGLPLLSFQDDRLKHPQQIAVDRGGAIYVSDPIRGSVFVFLPDGRRYRELRLQTKRDVENTLDVAVGDDGSVSVLDVSSARVFDFSASFRLRHVWRPELHEAGGQGRPHAIAAGAADAIYVGGIAPDSILRFTDGKFSAVVPIGGDSPSGRIGDALAVSGDHLFVMDADGHTLHIRTLEGKPSADVNLAAQLGDETRNAPPVAVSPLGELLVLDTAQARVLRYKINL